MISFVKLFSDAGSGQTEIFATFAPVVKSIEFVDIASGAETRLGWAACTSLARTVKWKTSWRQCHSCRAHGDDVIHISILHRSLVYGVEMLSH